MNTTIIIKVFERHRQLRNLMKSIRLHWPHVPIIVADDSRPQAQKMIKRICQDHQARHLALEFDVGLSRGRNLAVDQVDTDTFILMEEDFLIPEGGARLAKLVLDLRVVQADIVGGDLIQLNPGKRSRMIYAGSLTGKPIDGGIHVHHEPSKNDRGLERVDICLNFFAANTERIRQTNRWDDQLKLCEHFEFFWRAMTVNHLAVFIDHEVVIYHDHSIRRSPYYHRQRGRARDQFAPIAMAKHGIKLWTDNKQRIRYD